MDKTIDMAREAGLLTWLKPPEDVIERFKAFEALVRADEREACRGIAADYAQKHNSMTAVNIADAIRARGNT
jgi:hypothetical protein